MNVAELMAKIVVSVSPDEVFSTVVLLMREKNCSCILVSENEKPKGIVTERDVVRFLPKFCCLTKRSIRILKMFLSVK